MSFSLPYSRKRRYLTGIDWTIGTLNASARHITGTGNLSQVILELSGRPGEAKLRSALGTLSRELPIIHGRVARDLLNLAPYWRLPASPHSCEVPLNVAQASDVEHSEQLLADHVNTPLPSDGTNVRLLLVHVGPESSLLGLVFDHRLLDAFGGEAFLQLIEETSLGRLPEISSQIQLTAPAHLDNWLARLRAGKAVNRFRVRLSEKSVAALPIPRPGRHPSRFVHGQLNAEQVQAMDRLAGEEAQVPLLLPSMLARATQAFVPALEAAAVKERERFGEQVLVAVSVDSRTPGDRWRHLFFNHLSFLGFSCPPHDVAAAELALSLRDQWFEQMKEGIPAALESVTMLTRICPHWIGRRLPAPFGGRGCSFYFACLRDSAYTSETFLDAWVTNLRHTPRVPPPPGVGLCLTFFRGRMNVVLSYLDASLSEEAARQCMQRFMSALRR